MRRRREEAFSLLEVLTAITLFALVAAGVSSLATGSMLRTTENRHYAAAALIAADRLEQLRGLEYDDIQPSSSSTTMGGQAFDIGVDVQPDTPAAGMKQITVTISWTAPEGAKVYEVETIYTDITA
jgi:prepilin-type N-terminal cleavage/methylation domain-containing protein